MDMSLYRDLFVSEARGHLSAFNDLIIHLEESPRDSSAINELFRHAHSLKGMAATMGYEQIVAIAHLMEDKLGLIRSGEFKLLPELADLLLEGGDLLNRLVSMVETNTEISEDVSKLTANFVKNLTVFDPTTTQNDRPSNFTPDPATSNQNQSEPAAHQFRHSDSLNSIRIKTETLDRLVNITGELITNRYRLAESIRVSDAEECKEPLHQLTNLVRTLRDEVFKARMLPFTIIAERFPRMVRDLARKQGKEIQFQIEGKEIELDRGILEEISEPIVHILRNAVDHGMESADERVMGGKPFSGTITLTIRRSKEYVEIVIDDDGRGIDGEVLKLKGIERGIISTEQANKMTEQEIYQLICTPGFSTAETVTDVSGRGVGMDAVREAIHSLNGTLNIKSKVSQGSTFVMRLPTTISIIHAIIARCAIFDIVFPLSVVMRTVEIKPSEIIDTYGSKTILFDNVSVPVKSMRHILNIPESKKSDDTPLPMLLCDVGGNMVAFTVDLVVGQQEFFVRPLTPPLSELRGVNGATISGDGRVLFIIDVTALSPC